MTQGPETIYFLKNGKTGNYLTLINGIVMETANPTPLLYAPEGWDTVSIQNVRNVRFFALDRSFTVPLNFVEDGGKLLKHFAYKFGSEERIQLIIGQQRIHIDPNEYGFYYTMLYPGEIDFSNFMHTGPRVTVNIMEGGLAKLIKSRENVVYEIPTDVPERELMKMTGIKLFQKTQYIVTNGALVNDLGGSSLAMTVVASEAITSIGAVSQERIKSNNGPGALFETDNYFLLTGSQPTTITIDFDFKVLMRLSFGTAPLNPTNAVLNLHQINNDTGAELVPIPVYKVPTTDPVFLYNNKHTIKGAVTLTVPANTRLVFYLSTGPGANRNFTFFTYDNDGSISVQYDYVHRDTYIRVLPAIYVLQQLVNKMTDGAYTVRSEVMNKYREIKLASGDNIRGIRPAPIKTSFNAWFNSLNVVLCLGVRISLSEMLVETKESFVDYSSYVDLGECASLKVSFAPDYMYSSIKIGYPEQNYSDVNGRQEFNNTSQFTTPITRVNKELNLVSDYRADCYGIEFLRINLEGKTTTDSASDNEVFMIHATIDPVGYRGNPGDPDDSVVIYGLNRGLNQYVTGLLTPETVFNVWFSPKHCLYRQGRFIRSCFYRMDQYNLKFQTTDKNAMLEIRTPLSRPIIEREDEPIALLGPRLFQPVVLEFDTPVPHDLMEILYNNPLQAFQTRYLGLVLEGLPNKIGLNPETSASQIVQLLAGAETNLEPLIEIAD